MKTKRMRALRRGRARHDARSRQERMVNYRRSGQTPAAFCRAHGLHPGTFSGWLRKSPPATEAGFAQVELPPPPTEAIEIVLPGGTQVRLRMAGADIEQVAALVRRIAGC